MIKFPGKDVLVRNAAGTLQLPIDGLTRNFGDGNVITAFLTEDSLEIVTARTNGHWLWIETFYRRGERLVHLTETQNFSTPELLFQTVYDHTGGKPPPGRAAKVERSRDGSAAAIRIVPPRRRYRASRPATSSASRRSSPTAGRWKTPNSSKAPNTEAKSLTAGRPLLKARLHRLLAQGGTALNDGILFSLLQFRTEPGRRALVVVTDGDDLDSRSKPAQVTEYAERVGVPIYFIALGWSDPRGRLIKRLSRQTGGRLFRVHPGQSRAALARNMQQVFDRINEDLRHQHVLTYYSEHPQGAGVEPEVRTTRKGLAVKSVLPLEALQ